jgi:hypothetical protein
MNFHRQGLACHPPMTILNALVQRMNRFPLPTIDGQDYDVAGIHSKSGYYLLPTRSTCVEHTKEIVVKPEDDQNRRCQSVGYRCDENEREHNTYGKN